MISAKLLWGNVLLGGKLQIGAKNSNFEIFETALYMKSVSMPLKIIIIKTKFANFKKCSTSLKAYSLMLNRGRSQNCQNLNFFAYFRRSPLRNRIPQRN